MKYICLSELEKTTIITQFGRTSNIDNVLIFKRPSLLTNVLPRSDQLTILTLTRFPVTKPSILHSIPNRAAQASVQHRTRATESERGDPDGRPATRECCGWLVRETPFVLRQHPRVSPPSPRIRTTSTQIHVSYTQIYAPHTQMYPQKSAAENDGADVRAVRDCGTHTRRLSSAGNILSPGPDPCTLIPELCSSIPDP